MEARKSVHIYVDASFKSGSRSGLVYGPGGSALAWFGYEVQECHLAKLLSGRDKVRDSHLRVGGAGFGDGP